MDEKRAGQERFDRATHRLLKATEALHAAVVDDTDPGTLDSVREQREKAFESLREATMGEVTPGSAARACLSRIKILDDEIISLGAEVVGQLRRQRQSLHRRRSAIHAHGKRERGEPLLLTVKA